jgi:hypothetical protein
MRTSFSTLIERTPLGRLPPRHRGPAMLGAIAGVLLVASMIGLVVVLASPPGAGEQATDADDGDATQVAFSFDNLPAAAVEENPLAEPEPAVSDPQPSAEPVVAPPVAADDSASKPPKVVSPPQPEITAKPKPPTAASQTTPPKTTSKTASSSPKPPSPAPAINPFSEFPAAVSLPAMENTKQTSLGPIRVPEDYICVLYLLGGEGVSRGRTVFRCDNAQQGTRERAWEIFARDTSRNVPEMLIATFELSQQELKFAWTHEAVRCEGAAGLANCALKISAGRGVHKLALRKPKQINSVPIKFEKTTIEWDVPDTPRPDRANIEFFVAAPKELRPRFLGKSIVPATEGETWVEFGARTEDRCLKLQIEARLNAQSLEIVLTPFFQLIGQAKPLAVSEGNIKKVEESLSSAANTLSAQLRALGPEPKPSKDKKGNKSSSDSSGPRDEIKRQLAGVRKAQAQLKVFKSQEATFAKQVKLQVRANHLADEAIVQLVEPRK